MRPLLLLGVLLISCLPSSAQVRTVQSPQIVIQSFYSWIFQLRPPIPWTEVVRTRQSYFTEELWGTLRSQGPAVLDFDPLLDSQGGAEGYRIRMQQVQGTAAIVNVTILGGVGPTGSRDRDLEIHLKLDFDAWRIDNIYYAWAVREDLLSLCRRHRVELP